MSDWTERKPPTFTRAQLDFLQWAFPNRVIDRGETIEEHLRYAGRVDVVAYIATLTVDGPLATGDDETEEERIRRYEEEAGISVETSVPTRGVQ